LAANFLYRIFPIPGICFNRFNSLETGPAPIFVFTPVSTMKKLFPLLILVSIAACKNGEKKPEDPHPDAPKTMSYSIMDTYPHDTASYTQGLVIYKGEMYEGTGNWGFSKLRKIDIKTGKALNEISLDKKYFGEGITILNDTIYQLTYKERTVFAYSLKDFKKIKEFKFDYDGWGLTNDGSQLIVSTGASDLLYYDPATFRLLKTQTVTDAGSPTFNLNELEFIDGYIYANQYEYNYILKIVPASGKIVAKADLTDLWNRVKAIEPRADVLNGIAYDSTTKKIYITGKWWPQMYSVQFGE